MRKLSKRALNKLSADREDAWQVSLDRLRQEGYRYVPGSTPHAADGCTPLGLEPCTHFHRSYFNYQPATVIQWRWSIDWGRWSAHVRFEDGHEMVTFPAPRSDGNEMGSLFCRISRDVVVIHD